MKRAAAVLLSGVVGWLAAGCSRDLPRVDRIVLVTLDTTRADRIGCYGYENAVTPALDGLADEGVVFDQAVSTNPTTLPSHATILTGLYPPDHGVRYNLYYRLAEQAQTLAEALRDAGYATAGFPATEIVHSRFGLAQGFETWIDPPVPEGEQPPDLSSPATAPMRPAGEGVDLALKWLSGKADRPSFVWLHFYDPHWPYTPPFPYSSRFRDRPYDGEIAYADAQLGRLLDWLRADAAWGRTAVIVVGDHGEGLYEHDERYHSMLVYESTQRVPLIVRAPGARPARVAEPVTLADLMPTVLDLAHVEVPPVQRGISLVPALRGQPLPRRDLYFESLTGAINYGWAELYGLRYGAWKLIDSNRPELYDLANDPQESTNLADVEFERLAEMRTVLEDVATPLRGSEADGGAAAVPLDAETLERLSSLGYVAGDTSRVSRPDAPHPTDFVDLESELLAAQGALSQRRFDRVEEICRYVLTRDPTNLWALRSLVIALIESGRTREALEPALTLVEVNRDSPRAYAELAKVYQGLGRTREAHETLQRGLEIDPDSSELIFLSVVAAFDLELPEVCGESMRATFARFSSSPRFLVMQARCEAREGRVEAALDTLAAAVDGGFDELELVQANADFGRLVGTERFAELQETIRARRAARRPPAEPEGQAP